MKEDGGLTSSLERASVKNTFQANNSRLLQAKLITRAGEGSGDQCTEKDGRETRQKGRLGSTRSTLLGLNPTGSEKDEKTMIIYISH